MSKPYGVTIFCDDVRTEEGGKHIIIGAYDDGLGLPQAPALIPSFVFLVKMLEPLSYRGREGILKITAPADDENEIIFEEAMAPDRWDIIDNPEFDPEAEYLGANYIIRTSPLQVKAPGFFRVRAYYGEEEIRLGSLQVTIE